MELLETMWRETVKWMLITEDIFIIVNSLKGGLKNHIAIIGVFFPYPCLEPSELSSKDFCQELTAE